MSAFDVWKSQLAREIEIALGMMPGDGAAYVRASGDVVWRRMYDDAMTPLEAALEEKRSASQAN